MIRHVVAKSIENAVSREYDEYDKIPKRDYNRAIRNAAFRKRIRLISVEEDEDNSFYTGILNIIAEHCIGSVPLIMGNDTNDIVNDAIENKWIEWTVNNGIGSAIRQIRRGAARTGLGIGIPYQKKNDPDDPIGIGIKTVSSLRLTNPIGAGYKDRIYDGVEYDSNWDIKRIWIKDPDTIDPVEYQAKDIILWYKSITEDMCMGLPECGPAFCLFPSVRRYMDAIVRGEEFRSSIPMAVKLDPTVYRPEDATEVPMGAFEYEPGMVPTLPPGTDLVGLNVGIPGEERAKFVHLVIGAAARCVQMPKNLALGDSSNSNMATAQIDMQPWINRVNIDRVDFQPAIRKVVKLWYDRAILAMNYLPPVARQGISYEIFYDSTFEHPDPSKRAAARAADLISGSTTLHKVYTDQGLNPRQQLNREARTLGISRQELNKILIASRAKGMITDVSSKRKRTT